MPILNIEKLFTPYHEMDVTQFDKYIEELFKETPLSIWIKKRGFSVARLAKETEIPESTLRSLTYGQRDICKVQANYLEKIAAKLSINPRSLLQHITLDLYEPRYDEQNEQYKRIQNLVKESQSYINNKNNKK